MQEEVFQEFMQDAICEVSQVWMGTRDGCGILSQCGLAPAVESPPGCSTDMWWWKRAESLPPSADNYEMTCKRECLSSRGGVVEGEGRQGAKWGREKGGGAERGGQRDSLAPESTLLCL